MYSREERMRAVLLYLKYDRSSAAVRRELGYPSEAALREWVAEYEASGDLHERYRYRGRRPKYSEEQRLVAVNYCLEHGLNVRETVRALGYPSPELLRQWLDETIEVSWRIRTETPGRIPAKPTPVPEETAVVELCSRNGEVRDVAGKHGLMRALRNKWKSELLERRCPMSRPTDGTSRSGEDVAELESQVESLRKELEELKRDIHRLRLERDVLAVTAELLKKDEGADPANLSNREKTLAIGALRGKYRLMELLQRFALSKSSYFYQPRFLSLVR